VTADLAGRVVLGIADVVLACRVVLGIADVVLAGRVVLGEWQQS